ncbi:MAG: thiamine pyrophosphate-binding protein, partial [Candidatus Omnitrophota bacterium]
QHEQASAMAADAYSRVTGNLGVAVSTSGPGATNMITGICCAYYDSVPALYITGQVATFRDKADSGVRQSGFQETDIAEICKPITKYAIKIKSAGRIRFELEKAVHIAKSQRPGPVLIDIPDDIQRMEIEPNELEPFIPDKKTESPVVISEDIDRILALLSASKRPIIILGWGVRLSKSEEEAKKFINNMGFPVALTWGAMDILPFDHPLAVGSFGTHGTRSGNFAVQNADLVFAIGTRLDTHEAGSPMSSFARGAKKIIADVDLNELNKFEKMGMKADLLIHSDARILLQAVNRKIAQIPVQDISDWKNRIVEWKKKYPICPGEYYREKEINPYVFVEALSKESKEKDTFFIDTGCGLAWVMQAFRLKSGQRLVHDFNNTAMGYALPASIGACFALNKKPIICITGDGSLQMNIQELVTVIRHELPIKIFLINNSGYGMIQQTQDQWLGSRYLASTVAGGLAFPDFLKVARAYGYRAIDIATNKCLPEKIFEVLNSPGPFFCNVRISGKHRVIPQVKFGSPLEDSEPFLNREEFKKNMLIESAVDLTK